MCKSVKEIAWNLEILKSDQNLEISIGVLKSWTKKEDFEILSVILLGCWSLGEFGSDIGFRENAGFEGLQPLTVTAKVTLNN